MPALREFVRRQSGEQALNLVATAFGAGLTRGRNARPQRLPRELLPLLEYFAGRFDTAIPEQRPMRLVQIGFVVAPALREFHCLIGGQVAIVGTMGVV